MVAAGRVQGFELPMLQIFKPAYQEVTVDGNVVRPQEIQPSHFKRIYITDIPKKTGSMIQPLSITAHHEKFAFTHKEFKRIFVYHLK